MEEFAGILLGYDPTGELGLGEGVEGVWDMNLDFIVPSPNLFSLLPKRVPAPAAESSTSGGKGTNGSGAGAGGKKAGKEKEVDGPVSYKILNDPRATEAEIEEEAERIARGLFSVVVTMGT